MQSLLSTSRVLTALLAATISRPVAAQAPVLAVFDIAGDDAPLTAAELERLTDFLVAEIAATRQFQVVPRSQIREALHAKQAESYDPCYAEACQIEIGQELAATQTLASRVQRFGVRCVLTLTVYDLRQATSVSGATGKAGCSAEELQGLLESGVRSLVGSRLRTNAGTAKTPVGIEPIEGTTPAWSPKPAEEVVVTFASNPAGGVVIVDGELLCQSTPCKKSVSKGPHSLAMQAERYEKRMEQVTLDANATFEWTLQPAFATLSVISEPTGLDVFVDGEKVGQTPLPKHEIDPGTHEVWVEDRCFLKKGERFGLAKGQFKQLSLAPAARESAIEVSVEAPDGNAIEATAAVDGKTIGTTPGTWKVPLCSTRLQLRSADGAFEQQLVLREQETARIAARIDSRRQYDEAVGRIVSRMKARDFALIPAGEFWMGCVPRDRECRDDEKPGRNVYIDAFFIMRKEVTYAQYNECVRTRNCEKAPGQQMADQSFPMVNTRWPQAVAYCRWAGARLPTEAEWEKAARGTDGRIYPWGDERPTCALAVRQCRTGSWGTLPVGSKPAAANGLFDMADNAEEWVADVYEPDSYSRLGASNPASTIDESGYVGTSHVVRGAGGRAGGHTASERVSSRGAWNLDGPGFRCAISADELLRTELEKSSVRATDEPVQRKPFRNP
ncbi:MAG: SUMF1/EgtB/PvdO family nonheme iron enzyme [Deltaproteobacteria bacterium]|nr:SUMF1/EgtB/PvdO family nonheme iron enzyme [Deltaproteobacteria bacterium]